MMLSRFHSPAFISVPSLATQLLKKELTPSSPASGHKPAANVRETEDAFEVELLVPGIAKEDLKINFEKENLEIAFEKAEDQEVKNEEGTYTRREFSFRSFKRSFHVPAELIDAENITAKHTNGVLTIHLPKKVKEEKPTAKKIEIA